MSTTPVTGTGFIADELAEHGIAASENRVWRLCSAAADLLVARQEAWPAPQAWTASARRPAEGHRQARPPDPRLHRRGPNIKWLTDITEHPTAEGKLYLCAVKDCYANKIVGYSIDSRMKSSLAVSAIRNAISLRTPVGTIVHSDRGSQFRSK